MRASIRMALFILIATIMLSGSISLPAQAREWEIAYPMKTRELKKLNWSDPTPERPMVRYEWDLVYPYENEKPDAARIRYIDELIRRVKTGWQFALLRKAPPVNVRFEINNDGFVNDLTFPPGCEQSVRESIQQLMERSVPFPPVSRNFTANVKVVLSFSDSGVKVVSFVVSKWPLT